MHITHIKTFLKVAECANFRKAAEALQYTQPTVTLQIQALKKELNTVLFNRMPKGIALTDQGEQFLPYARKIVQDWEVAADVLSCSGQISGHINIGCPDSIALFLLPDIVKDFCRLGSNASVKIRTGELPALIQEMEENALDIIYIINRPFHFAKWQKHYEKQEHIVFVCRPDHPLAGQEEVTLREIAGHKMVLADSGSTTSYIHELHQAFDAQGLVPDCMLEISNTAILKSMVLDGIGLTFLPYFVVRQEVEAGQLTILPVRELCPELWLQVFSVRGKWISPAMEWFPEEIKKR